MASFFLVGLGMVVAAFVFIMGKWAWHNLEQDLNDYVTRRMPDVDKVRDMLVKSLLDQRAINMKNTDSMRRHGLNSAVNESGIKDLEDRALETEKWLCLHETELHDLRQQLKAMASTNDKRDHKTRERLWAIETGRATVEEVVQDTDGWGDGEIAWKGGPKPAGDSDSTERDRGDSSEPGQRGEGSPGPFGRVERVELSLGSEVEQR